MKKCLFLAAFALAALSAPGDIAPYPPPVSKSAASRDVEALQKTAARLSTRLDALESENADTRSTLAAAREECSQLKNEVTGLTEKLFDERRSFENALRITTGLAVAFCAMTLFAAGCFVRMKTAKLQH
ncbi:MAG: hypothetical protein IJ802_05170 [Kiritimatiellae bacterium]|nr:hypothetical protein [Kiritimatiellia bacterium]